MPAEITSGPMPSAGIEAMLYLLVDDGGAIGWSTEIDPMMTECEKWKEWKDQQLVEE